MGPDNACKKNNMRKFMAVKYNNLGENLKGVVHATH
jgi:hypothetical protein